MGYRYLWLRIPVIIFQKYYFFLKRNPKQGFNIL